MRLLRLPEPFDHPDFLYEVKFDGFRALAHINGHHCQLVSRNGLSQYGVRRHSEPIWISRATPLTERGRPDAGVCQPRDSRNVADRLASFGDLRTGGNIMPARHNRLLAASRLLLTTAMTVNAPLIGLAQGNSSQAQLRKPGPDPIVDVRDVDNPAR